MYSIDDERAEPRYSNMQSFWRSAAVIVCVVGGVVAAGMLAAKEERSEKQAPATTQQTVLPQGAKITFPECVKSQLDSQSTLGEIQSLGKVLNVAVISSTDDGRNIQSFYEIPSDPKTPTHIITVTSRGSEIMEKTLVEEANYTRPQKSTFVAIIGCRADAGF